MDARALIETLRNRGVDLRVNGDRIRVEAPQEPDGDTKALLAELREHREEVKAILIVPPPCWNCGAIMTETTDIYGRRWWTCWECAVTV